MKITLHKALVWAVIASGVCFTSCSDKDDKTNPDEPEVPENPSNPDNPNKPEPSPVTGVLSAEQAKEYLESAALDFMGKFRPADQKGAVESVRYAIDTYSDLDAPADWDINDNDSYWSPARVCKAIRTVLSSGNAGVVARAFDDLYKFADYTGVYEPGRDAWERVGDSNDVIFRFQGKNGACELKATAEGNSWELEMDDASILVPGKLTVTFTEGSNRIFSAVMVTSGDMDRNKFSADITATVANLAATVKLTGSETKITEDQILSVDGVQVLSSTADINGTRMISAIDDEGLDFDVFNHVNGGKADIDVMGRVQLHGDAAGVSSLKGIKSSYDTYDYMTALAAENACRNACNTINSAIEGTLRFGGTDHVQATVTTQPELYEDNEYWTSWKIVGVAVFAADGSSQSFDEYFSTGFSGVESRFDSLLESYRRLFR